MTETLVLLPDMMCDARGWATVSTVLSYERPVMFAPIWNGERIEELASNILSGAPAKFALAGHGMGGVIALEIFRRAPERVIRLALIGTNLLSDTPQEAADREPLMIGTKAGRFEDLLTRQVIPTLVGPGEGRTDHMALLSEMAQALGPEVFVRQQRAMQRRRDQQSTVRRLTQPVLVLAGELDQVVPLKRQAFLAELVPYAQFTQLDGVGHSVMLEDPEGTIEALHRWMRQPLVLR